MPNYDKTFNARGNLYNNAMALCPQAREPERQHLLRRLAVESEDVVVDAPAGGGYLAEGLSKRTQHVICVEPAARFAEAIGERFRTVICPLTQIQIEDGIADHVGSLAGLHHLEGHEVSAFFDESCRLLKGGGRIAVADVKLDTAVAAFLNGPVDTWTETGHDGRFFANGELAARLEEAGFEEVEESWETFSWDFPDAEVMTRFCRSLFGLTLASLEDVRDLLETYLDPWEDDHGVHLPWSLLYATGRRPETG